MALVTVSNQSLAVNPFSAANSFGTWQARATCRTRGFSASLQAAKPHFAVHSHSSSPNHNGAVNCSDRLMCASSKQVKAYPLVSSGIEALAKLIGSTLALLRTLVNFSVCPFHYFCQEHYVPLGRVHRHVKVFNPSHVRHASEINTCEDIGRRCVNFTPWTER
jgi:hypothetical protein